MKPELFRNLAASASLCVAAAMCAGQAVAAPIVYSGALTPGVTVFGTVGPAGLSGSPEDEFWTFSAIAGETVTLTVNRLESALDPAFEVYFGTGVDTGALVFVGSADDNIAELPGFAGPFDDPQLSFTASATGDYTVQVWSFASGDPGPDGRFCYQLTLGTPPSGALGPSCDAAVPEPGSMALLGLGLFGLAGLRRRLK